MRSGSSLTAAVAVVWAVALVAAQTYTNCNPLTDGTFPLPKRKFAGLNSNMTTGSCPPDTALGKSVKIDFTAGQSDSFTAQGTPTYDSNGASFTVAGSGDAPLIASKWYIMFGHVEFVLKAAPGVGIVSSAILQSDDLDEIDFEWLGYDGNTVQTNFFGKGLTTSYNRGASSPAPGNHDGFHTYAIDWTADQIVWSVNGATVRTLTPSATNGYPYPQSPMMIKIGSWSGGDFSNPVGTRGKSWFLTPTLTNRTLRCSINSMGNWPNGRHHGLYFRTLHYACEIHCRHRLLDRKPIQILGHRRYLAIHYCCRWYSWR